MLYCATEAWHVIVARFIVGLCGGGVFICFPLFIAEISSEQYVYYPSYRTNSASIN